MVAVMVANSNRFLRLSGSGLFGEVPNRQALVALSSALALSLAFKQPTLKRAKLHDSPHIEVLGFAFI